MTRQPFPKLLRPFVSLLLGIAIINLMATAGRAGDDKKTFKKQPYAGSQARDYIVHVPDNIDRLPKPVPLVVVLHGCEQTNEIIQHDTNFDAVADQEGFITLYPDLTDPSRQGACWGWWMPPSAGRRRSISPKGKTSSARFIRHRWCWPIWIRWPPFRPQKCAPAWPRL